jgi:hypothetical protein
MNDELFEKLAAIEHERWADWQKYVHGKLIAHRKLDCKTTQNPEGNFDDFVLSKELFDHWERQIKTPYAELSEEEKESDREQVRRYWELLNASEEGHGN